MTLDAAAIAATWALSDETGIRPEYVIPVWYEESGLDPSRPNAAGYPYYGLAQTSSSQLAARGIAPADYLTWSAADQISHVIAPAMASMVRTFGPIRSATRAYQGNFLPATLKTARGLMQIVAPWGSAAYRANRTLDVLDHGAITVSDLSIVMSRAVSSRGVATSLLRAYTQRPNETMREPVYGEDFVDPLWSGSMLFAGLAAPTMFRRG